MSSFIEKIKDLRTNTGLSQKAFADKLGLQFYIIGNWEQGRSEPSMSDIILISQTFSVSTDYLLGLEDDLGNKNINVQANFNLSSDEERLLRAFRSLSELEKGKLIEDAEFYAQRLGVNKHIGAK